MNEADQSINFIKYNLDLIKRIRDCQANYAGYRETHIREIARLDNYKQNGDSIILKLQKEVAEEYVVLQAKS